MDFFADTIKEFITVKVSHNVLPKYWIHQTRFPYQKFGNILNFKHFSRLLESGHISQEYQGFHGHFSMKHLQVLYLATHQIN